MVVLDASVAIKWLLEESDSNAALLVLEDLEFTAPAILDLEFKGAILKALKNKRINVEHGKNMLAEWQNTLWPSIEFHDTTTLEDMALDIAFNLLHDYYDCLYLALAMQQTIPIITADKIFAARAGKIYSQVMLLADYGK